MIQSIKWWLKCAWALLLVYAIVHEIVAPAQGGEFPVRMNLGQLPPEVTTLREAVGASSMSVSRDLPALPSSSR